MKLPAAELWNKTLTRGGGEQAHTAQTRRVEEQIAKAPDVVQTSCRHK